MYLAGDSDSSCTAVSCIRTDAATAGATCSAGRPWTAGFRLPLVLFVATTGLRFGEASALHWEDVRNGEAHTRWTNDRGTLTPSRRS